MIADEPLPECLPGFEAINRFWDRQHEIHMAKILPGEFYVTKNHEVIATTLGSCVSACIWDSQSKIGGMNHFMLPYTTNAASSVDWSSLPSNATRYGNYAMEHLINEIISHGGQRGRLQAKVFGGSTMLSADAEGALNVGQENIRFVLSFLETDNIQLVASDLGECHPRKLIFNPITGRARVKLLTMLHNNTIQNRENHYQQTLNQQPVEGDIELF